MTEAEDRLPRGILMSIHGAYWLMYATAIVVLLGVATVRGARISSSAAASLVLVGIVPEVLAFYFSYGVLFARFLRPRRFAMLVVGAIFTAASSSALSLAIALAIFGAGQVAFREPVEATSLAISLFLLAGVHVATALVIRGFVAWSEAAAAAAELRRRNLEAELALVRAQLEPHFLFNTLNNIDTLIEMDPPAASRYLNGLAELLRFIVYEAPAETVALDHEITLIRRYISLQELRSADGARAGLTVAGDVANRSVAPMLLFPFVENAFKHGARKGRIEISVAAGEDRIEFSCRNAIGDKVSESGGRGGDLVGRRLELLYPGRHRLETAADHATYEVRLTIYDI